MQQIATSVHRLLVLDDDASQREALQDVLQAEGFEVAAYATIDAAIERCEQESFVVAIVDIVSEGQDSLDRLKQIQHLQPRMRTIVHTEHVSFDAANKAIDLRAFAVVEKDSDSGELISRVHRAIEEALAEALIESEERYRHLLDDVVAIVWEAELPSWRFTFVSKHAETILGYPVSEWLSQPDFWVGVLHEEDRDRCVRFCMECTARGEQHEFDYRAISADGRVVWLHDVVHVVTDEEGVPVKLRGVMFDITQRKGAEQALLEIKEQGARAEEVALIMTVHATLDGKWLKVPQRFCDYLGYSAGELLNQSVSEYTHPDDRVEGVRQRDRLLAGDIQSVDREKRYIRKDGQIVWSYINCSIVTDSNGEPLYLRTYVKDITEKKVAEEALLLSESRYRSLVECSPICIHEIDLDGRLASMNPAGLKMVNLTDASKVLGKDYLGFVHPDDRSRIEALMAAALEGESATYTFRCLVAGGERLFASNLIPITDENGAVIKLMGTTEDVTERASAEASLRDSEETFRQLAENINAVFWMRSGDGSEQLYVSPKYEQIWGRDLESILARPESFLETVLEEDWPQLIEAFNKLREGGAAEDYDIEYRIHRPDGEIRWIHDRGFSIYDDEGNVTRQAGFAEDVTRRMDADAKLRERESQLAHVSRLSTMGEMVAGIAHEINQPLSAIANFALASLNAINMSGNEYEVPVQQWLDNINKQAVHCGDIIRRLRNYVRHGDNQREWTNLNDVVHESVALIKSDTRHSSLNIQCCLPTKSTLVNINSIQLQQVIVNLLRNACDATSKVETPCVEIRVERNDDHVWLTVEDNGHGVDAAAQQKLFDAFYTTKADGMGMGLAISKSIIEAHGGKLRLDTGSTRVTSFHIELPQTEPAKEPSP